MKIRPEDEVKKLCDLCLSGRRLERLNGPRRQPSSAPLHRAAHEEQGNKNQKKRMVLQPAESFLNVPFEELHCLSEKPGSPPSGRGAFCLFFPRFYS
jgi:hypothetical protein